MLTAYRNNQGLTAIEMMVTLIIVGILAAVAFPSFQDLIQNYRAKSISTEFNAALAYARSEAIKRGQTVTICPTANTNFTACGNASNWQDGWIVFLDPNNDGIIANAQDRLTVQNALTNGTTFTTASARISFDSLGFSANGTSTVSLSAPNCTGNHGRQYDISNTGRVAITAVTC